LAGTYDAHQTPKKTQEKTGELYFELPQPNTCEKKTKHTLARCAWRIVQRFGRRVLTDKLTISVSATADGE